MHHDSLAWPSSKRPRHPAKFVLIGLCWLYGRSETPTPPPPPPSAGHHTSGSGMCVMQMVRGWPASLWERCLPAVEAAMKASCQDAQSATRETGRCMFAVYAASFPSQAPTFLSKLDMGLQSRLRQTMLSGSSRESYCHCPPQHATLHHQDL